MTPSPKLPDYLTELGNCRLCEHRCGVDRLSGERGPCGAGLPDVASARLHPAPPESYTVFLRGCNYRCLNCQNWTIAGPPITERQGRGFVPADALAAEAVEHLHSLPGRLMGADRLFFSGGEATIHLPYVEEVVRRARELDPEVRVNFDTNGFLTERSLRRVLSLSTSITFDIKAFYDDTHRALTGCPIEPVLRNAEIVGGEHADQLWEFRVLVVPGINDQDIEPLVHFIADIDRRLPVSFLAFRPNMVLDHHPGAPVDLMRKCVRQARLAGLERAEWAGAPGIRGESREPDGDLRRRFERRGAALGASYARGCGCDQVPRDCGNCSHGRTDDCPIRRYLPERTT